MYFWFLHTRRHTSYKQQKYQRELSFTNRSCYSDSTLMSRAAAASATKAGQKAALKEKAQTHTADLAMGLTSTMKKAMAGDTLLCTVCRATALGPNTSCECPGGRSKPAADYDPKVELLAAALERQKLSQKSKMAAGAARQGKVQATKAKQASERDADAAGLDLSTMDMVDLTFPAGQKLGMSIEKHAVRAVTEEGAAVELKVERGWVIRKVNGEDAPPAKAAIMKLCAAAMKTGLLTITFQFPLEAGQAHCSACDKFVDASEFDGATHGIEQGPGKQVCYSCEEYGDMFG